MPPTRAARWITTSGRCFASSRRMSSSWVRSNSALRGTKTTSQPASCSRPTRCLPRNPEPPVTMMRLCRRSICVLSCSYESRMLFTAISSDLAAGAMHGSAQGGDVGVHHHVDELLEAGLALPAEHLVRLRWIGQEQVDL